MSHFKFYSALSTRRLHYLTGLDAYLSDVLKRLPIHKVTKIEELLPHRWKPNQIKNSDRVQRTLT